MNNIGFAYHNKLVAFFKEWSIPMLADFYRFEYRECGLEYKSIDETYFKDKAKDEKLIILEFLKNNSAYFTAINALFGKSELPDENDVSDEKLKTYIKNRRPHERTILLAFAKGFLIEWLFFYLDIVNYDVLFSIGEENISNDKDYGEWKDNFRKRKCSRIELMKKYPRYNDFYYYYRILVRPRIMESFFEWVHSKDIVSDFKELLIELIRKHFSFEDCIYCDYCNFCKRKSFNLILIEKLPQLKGCLDNKRAQLFFTKAYYTKKISISDDDNHFKWEGRSLPLLAYFCGKVYHQDFVDDQGRWQRNVKACGNENFHDKELRNLFNLKYLGIYRRKKKDDTAPPGYQEIDELFDE